MVTQDQCQEEEHNEQCIQGEGHAGWVSKHLRHRSAGLLFFVEEDWDETVVFDEVDGDEACWVGMAVREPSDGCMLLILLIYNRSNRLINAFLLPCLYM